MRGAARRQGGFTLIEILVSIAILAVLAAVLTATLTGSLGLNREAQQQLGTTSQAQQLLEQVRGAWSTQDNYDRACAPIALPAGYSVRFQSLDARANVLGTGTAGAPTAIRTTTCATQSVVNAPGSSPAAPPRMRRLVVTSQTGRQDVTLTLDVLRPQ
ncbi:type II secretion system protein [Deinococcus sp. SDU3-2]|uniref:Type II secretion system protein n=1 Tax=Deinococcus terrestris TaxID=2651870 RepID=A0A7X1TRQ9_9DEIO|nr:type II secretion system protein [Deinococcus terrestris]MPY66597.1 type II secretion system protein [Deinococcus terrestris]